jgi:hypothetical protein
MQRGDRATELTALQEEIQHVFIEFWSRWLYRLSSHDRQTKRTDDKSPRVVGIGLSLLQLAKAFQEAHFTTKQKPNPKMVLWLARVQQSRVRNWGRAKADAGHLKGQGPEQDVACRRRSSIFQ